MKIPNLKDSLRQEWGDLWMLYFGQNGSGVLFLWRITDQACLRQNGLFWHPWVVRKFLQARLRLWGFRTCTGCKS